MIRRQVIARGAVELIKLPTFKQKNNVRYSCYKLILASTETVIGDFPCVRVDPMIARLDA